MGVLFGRNQAPTAQRGFLEDVGILTRSAGGSGSPATPETALRFSAVWAALRLRADLISTLPVDNFRRAGGYLVEVPKTRLFTRPAEGMLWNEWCYSSQMDLDRYGNTMGHIVARENGYPTQIELWPASEVSVQFTGNLIRSYRYNNRDYAPMDVWHERQYTVAGYRVGLSPLAYAAWTIGGGLAAQSFGLEFYSTGAHPSGTLRNTEQALLDPKVLDAAKARFKVAVSNRDIFATGKEWEFTPGTSDANTAQFLEEQRASAVDVARYIGVPASAIDAAVDGQSITYQNMAQKQLDLLVNFINPAIVRRELKLTADGLPAPRIVKLNSDAIMRLDPTGRVAMTKERITSRTLDPNEARALDNLPPLTTDQVELFAQLFPKQSAPADTTTDTTTLEVPE